MKKIVFILMLVVSSSYAYFQSDFLKNNYDVTPPYFYGHYEYGGGLDILENYLGFLNSAVTGKLSLDIFDKSSSLLNSYMKFNHNVFGFDMFLYDKMQTLDTSTTKTDRKDETTILVAHMYQNNKIYNHLKAGIEISPFLKRWYYTENDHNILTSDYKATNVMLGTEIYCGVDYSPLSSLNFLLQSGPQILYNINSQTTGFSLVGKLSVKYYTQLYILTPLWLSVESYYVKNFFEDNFGCELFVKPNRIVNVLLGINQDRVYTSVRIRPLNFGEFQFYGEYGLKQKNSIIITTGMTLYYKGLGMPTFR